VGIKLNAIVKNIIWKIEETLMEEYDAWKI
jgi:hypothetical protein